MTRLDPAAERAGPSKRVPLVAAAALALVTVVSLVLHARNPMWLLADLGFDEALIANLAGELVQGQWLGPYHGLILSKGPAYPIFIAVAYKLHLPLLLADQLVHLVAAAIVAIAAWRLSRSAWLGIGVYVVLALDPTYFGPWGSRVSRETLYESLALMLVGSTILFLTEAPGLTARGLRWAAPVIAVRNRQKAVAMAADVPPPAATASPGDGASTHDEGASPTSPTLVAP